MYYQNSSLSVLFFVGALVAICCPRHCNCDNDDEILRNRGTIAYHQSRQEEAILKSDELANFNLNKNPITNLSHELQNLEEDENEFRQLRETTALFDGDVSEDSLAGVKFTHEKHHLWKMSLVKSGRDSTVTQISSPTTDRVNEIQKIKSLPSVTGKTLEIESSSKVQEVEPMGKKEEEEKKGEVQVRNLPGENSMDFYNNNNAIGKEKSTTPETVRCTSCILNKQLEDTLSAEALRQVRLEVIKEQILRKLGLKEPPNTTFLVKEGIPAPVAQGSTLPKKRHPHLKNIDRDVDDFYGKTEQVIVFPEDVMPRCVTHRMDPSACFTFKVPQDNKVDLVSLAELWVYKLPDEKDGRNQSFWVDEISGTDINHSSVRARNIDIKQDIPIREDWLKLNLTKVMSKWLSSNKTEHTLQIGCKTCLLDPYKSPIATQGEQRPFIAINYKMAPTKKRSRRNINCSPQLTECCRESFEVSFREIGWDSWIIGPPSYNAYYCKGSCVSINAFAQSMARHTTVMQRYIRAKGITNSTAELVPCCTAVKMSPISLLYRDPNNLNHTVQQKILPNMVVDSCGCL